MVGRNDERIFGRGNRMKCEQCSNQLYEYNFLSLRKYREINDDEILEESHDFCSTECAKKFIEGREVTGEFELYEITRCVGYYDCERLDNLRVACESREPVVKSGPFDLPHTQLRPNCSPAEVGMIKSSLKLLDLFEQFERSSTQLSQEMLDHTKEMNRLTKWILAFTIVNAFMIIIQIILILNQG